MERRSIGRIALAAAVSLLMAAAGRAQEERPRAFVLDTGTHEVVALALDNGDVLGKALIQGDPERLIISPDGSRLVALDKGPGKQTMRFGYHPTGKSWATVLEADSLRVLSRVELGWNVNTGVVLGVSVGEPWVFGPDGKRLTLSCLGYRSQKPEETLARELVNLDLETGQPSARLELPREIDRLLPLPAGDAAVVYSGRDAPKNKPAVPAQLRFVDLATLTGQETVVLDGDPGPPELAPAGDRLYLLEYGKPDKKPEKNVNGRIQVIALSARAHEINLDAGRAPRGLVVDDDGQQVFVLSDGQPSVEKRDVEPGALRVIRAAEVVRVVEVGEDPLFLRTAPGRERLYVVSEKTLTSVDLLSLTASGPAQLKPAGISLLTAGGGRSTVKELAISRDGKRGYALYAASSKLGIFDLENRKMLAEVSTGRGGVKFAKFLGAVAMTAASAYAGQSMAAASGANYYTYNVYGVAPANTALVLSLDESMVYVLNTHSNDVTIVNAGTREIVDKIGIGGAARRVELLPGGDFVAVTTGADTLHLIDTKTNKQVSELPDGGNYVHSPDKRYATAFGKEMVYCLDGASLKTLGRARGFKKPAQVVFVPVAEARPGEVESTK